MTALRVLNLIDTGGPGGAETVFLQTCTGLSREQFAVTPVVSREGWLASALRAAGASPSIVPARGSFNLGYLMALRRLLMSDDCQVILAHLFGSAVYGCLLGLLTHRPVVVVLHGHTDIDSFSLRVALKLWLVKKIARRVIFVSPMLQQHLAEVLPIAAAKALVIPNGVDLGRFRPHPDNSLREALLLPADAILVGAVGNIRTPKDYATFLRAAALLRSQDTRYHFVICGEGGNALHTSLLVLRSALGLDGCCHFLGLREDVEIVLNNLDIYALSSTTEGFSISCIEAMACAVPVVATRSGGPELIIEDGVTGVLVPVVDAAGLATAIATVANTPALSKRLIEAGLKKVRNHYALPVMLNAYGLQLRSAVGALCD